MNTLKPDSRNRITLPKNVVQKDREYVAYRMPNGRIVLHPVSTEDPLHVLWREGRKLRGKSTKQLRREAEQLAMEEAGNDLRRH